MARDFDRQVAEFQVRVAVLNGFTALGSPSLKPQDESVRAKGRSACHPICATEPMSEHIQRRAGRRTSMEAALPPSPVPAGMVGGR